MKLTKPCLRLIGITFAAASIISCSKKEPIPNLDIKQIACDQFNNDSSWYIKNVPFFECSDKQIENVYYYRWKMYKAHIRNTGPNQFVVTEFINHMDWDREPYCTINAASMHHIYEGRWLKDQRFMDGYISYLFSGGNNRSYSESITDAAYARYLVNADFDFISQQLDSMISLYNQWDDHWEAEKSLYYIPAMPDATEYTIASIDASGGKDGFEGGEAFRPTINSYMYANALAISKIAKLKGLNGVSDEFAGKATDLKSNIERNLWNDSLKHFTDRFKVDNQFVHYWDFIRGRELAGMIPWYFNLPSDNPKFNQAWKHAIDTTQLLGGFGYRTNEPSYEYYFKQYVYYQGQRGSQWNGPSWPYQSSQVLTAMANFLNNYNQDIVTNSDYIHALRLFARQHILPNGKINLVENYDPNLGGPIVYYYWSNHYNHSSFNNLIITGLCGLRPSEGDTVTINPLIDNSIDYFFLDEVLYHGHKLKIIFDRSGDQYKIGKGLTVFVDGQKTEQTNEGKYIVGNPIIVDPINPRVNYALNISKKNQPQPSASVNNITDSLYQALDGRIWYFPEITNGWSTLGSTNKTDWYAIDFGESRELHEVKIYPMDDTVHYQAPTKIAVEYFEGNQWKPVHVKDARQLKPNTMNVIQFEGITTNQIRYVIESASKPSLISEFEAY